MSRPGRAFQIPEHEIPLKNDRPEEMGEEEWTAYIDSLVPLLGWFIVAFNNLERTIDHWLAWLIRDRLETDELSWILIERTTASQKIQVLTKALRHLEREYTWFPHLLETIDSLDEKLRHANAQRNVIVHSDYTSATSEQLVLNAVRVDRRDGPKYVYRQLDTETIDSAINGIEELSDELDKYMEDIAEMM